MNHALRIHPNGTKPEPERHLNFEICGLSQCLMIKMVQQLACQKGFDAEQDVTYG
jgi:hypothetical protein